MCEHLRAIPTVDINFVFNCERDRNFYKDKVKKWFDYNIERQIFTERRNFATKPPTLEWMLREFDGNAEAVINYLRANFILTEAQQMMYSIMLVILGGMPLQGNEGVYVRADSVARVQRLNFTITQFKQLMKLYSAWLMTKETMIQHVYKEVGEFKPLTCANPAIVVQRNSVENTYVTKLPVTQYQYLLGKCVGMMGRDIDYSYKYLCAPSKKV